MKVFNWLFGAAKPTVVVRHQHYTDAINLVGRDILSLRSRDDALKLFPFLAHPTNMSERKVQAENVTAKMCGEVADEVHEFENARQGGTRIVRLMLKNDKVVELCLGNWERQYPTCIT